MYRLEIEINERIKKDLKDFILEQKNDIVEFSETCGVFAMLGELEEDFEIYDTIESQLGELDK